VQVRSRFDWGATDWYCRLVQVVVALHAVCPARSWNCVSPLHAVQTRSDKGVGALDSAKPGLQYEATLQNNPPLWSWNVSGLSHALQTVLLLAVGALDMYVPGLQTVAAWHDPWPGADLNVPRGHARQTRSEEMVGGTASSSPARHTRREVHDTALPT
jgi:hypothetical protein